MPPWEISKVLLGLLVSDNVPGAEGEELDMAIFDISRAHFMVPMEREACIELPEEDKLPEDGDAVGLLQRSMYGFRTASANWMKDWQATFEGGYKVGLRILHCSTEVNMGAVVELTERIFLLWAHVVHWTGWARLCLASFPCESRIDLGLEVTVNVMPRC